MEAFMASIFFVYLLLKLQKIIEFRLFFTSVV